MSYEYADSQCNPCQKLLCDSFRLSKRRTSSGHSCSTESPLCNRRQQRDVCHTEDLEIGCGVAEPQVRISEGICHRLVKVCQRHRAVLLRDGLLWHGGLHAILLRQLLVLWLGVARCSMLRQRQLLLWGQLLLLYVLRHQLRLRLWLLHVLRGRLLQLLLLLLLLLLLRWRICLQSSYR